MKIIENTDVMESFGMKNLTMDEILNTDGGFTFGDICAGKNGCFVKITPCDSKQSKKSE